MQKLPILYVVDKKQFFDTRTKRYLSEKNALEKLIQIYENKSIQDIKLILDIQKDIGVNSEELPIYKNKNQIPLDNLYEEVCSIWPFKYCTLSKGQRITYFVSDENEATALEGDDYEHFRDSLLSEPDYFKRIKDAHKNSLILSKLKGHVEFEKYLEHICTKFKTDLTKQIKEEPKRISWNPQQIAFKQFNPSLLKHGLTPTWDEFLQRLDYPEIFMAWVWSLFDEENSIRQVMWLRGGGTDGKSTVMNALTEIYGVKYSASLGVGSEFQQWFYARIYGKGLVTYPDCQNMELINNNRIKQTTSGDRVPVEEKFEKSFDAFINCKFLVSSNPQPKIDLLSNAQTSRLIKLEVSTPKLNTRTHNFKEGLISESYSFLYKCKEMFFKYVEQDKKVEIKLPESLIKNIERECASTDFHTLSQFIDQTLEFGVNFYYKMADFNKDLNNFIAEQGLSPNKKFDKLLVGFENRKEKLNIIEDRILLPEYTYPINVLVGVRKKGSINELS